MFGRWTGPSLRPKKNRSLLRPAQTKLILKDPTRMRENKKGSYLFTSPSFISTRSQAVIGGGISSDLSNGGGGG